MKTINCDASFTFALLASINFCWNQHMIMWQEIFLFVEKKTSFSNEKLQENSAILWDWSPSSIENSCFFFARHLFGHARRCDGRSLFIEKQLTIKNSTVTIKTFVFIHSSKCELNVIFHTLELSIHKETENRFLIWLTRDWRFYSNDHFIMFLHA